MDSNVLGYTEPWLSGGGTQFGGLNVRIGDFWEPSNPVLAINDEDVNILITGSGEVRFSFGGLGNPYAGGPGSLFNIFGGVGASYLGAMLFPDTVNTGDYEPTNPNSGSIWANTSFQSEGKSGGIIFNGIFAPFVPPMAVSPDTPTNTSYGTFGYGPSQSGGVAWYPTPATLCAWGNCSQMP